MPDGSSINAGIFGVSSGGGGGSGTVTSVSVSTANGFAGTVATPTTTPAISVQTSITGLLKGNGTAVSAAVAGTDYTASVTAADTSIVIGGSSGAVTVATGTLDVIATQHAPAADWSNNSHKITSLANGTGAQDAAAFGQIPTTLVNKLTLSTITADPNPAVIGTYYRANYAGNGNFTLPTSPATGSWVMVKMLTNHTLTIIGTVDGVTNPTASQFTNLWMVYNGTNWDFI